VVAGVIVGLAVWLSVMHTVFTPREQSSLTARWTAKIAGSAMLATARALPCAVRERFLGYATPLMLFAMAAGWLTVGIAGFALLAYGVSAVPLSTRGLGRFFSLRSADTPLAALSWLYTMLLLTAFAVHLIRLTSAYTRRERLVGRLSATATRSPDAETVFAEYARLGCREPLGELFSEWSDWLADVESTHLAYPSLVYYRSSGDMCWTAAVQIVLDCAALALSCTPDWAPPQTGSLLTAGERCLPRVAARLGIVLPRVPVSYQGREMYPFSSSLAKIRGTGLPRSQRRTSPGDLPVAAGAVRPFR
jgi:hypothetical protein